MRACPIFLEFNSVQSAALKAERFDDGSCVWCPPFGTKFGAECGMRLQTSDTRAATFDLDGRGDRCHGVSFF